MNLPTLNMVKLSIQNQIIPLHGMMALWSMHGDIPAAINAFERASYKQTPRTYIQLGFPVRRKRCWEAAKYAKVAIDLGPENDNLEALGRSSWRTK